MHVFEEVASQQLACVGSVPAAGCVGLDFIAVPELHVRSAHVFWSQHTGTVVPVMPALLALSL